MGFPDLSESLAFLCVDLSVCAKVEAVRQHSAGGDQHSTAKCSVVGAADPVPPPPQNQGAGRPPWCLVPINRAKQA